MPLEDIGCEPVGELRHVWRLEGAGRDHDLVGLEPRVLESDDEPSLRRRERAHRAVELDRKLEGRRVLLQVGDHLVARRVAVRVAGKGKPSKGGVAPRREQHERVPAFTPRGTDGAACLEDHEATALAGEEVAHRKTGLAGSDHGDVEALGNMLARHSATVPVKRPRERLIRIHLD
jgi:hypothetical protein